MWSNWETELYEFVGDLRDSYIHTLMNITVLFGEKIQNLKSHDILI